MVNASKTGLALLLAIYISNQWSRYSIVYLGGVAISECPGKHAGDPCFFDGESEPPLCSSYECKTEQCRICQQCYEEHNASQRNLKYGSCISSYEYGIMVSYGYMAVFCVMGLFAGRLADTMNRRNLVAVAVTMWSIFTVVQGLSTSFQAMLLARLGMGLSHAFSGPASLSMIADLFGPETRGRANGIYTFGIYVGGGLSSLSLLVANNLGWRAASFCIAAVGLLGGALLIVLVPEPKRNAFAATAITDVLDADESTPLPVGRNARAANAVAEQEGDGEEADVGSGYRQLGQNESSQKKPLSYMKALSAVASDRVVLLVFLAAPLRFLGGFAIGTFLPQFYSRKFESKNDVYGTLNALIVSVGGATSAYLGGLITDRWKQTNPRAPALVPAIASMLAMLPFFGVLYAEDFYVSIACLLLEYLIAESWFGPAISLIQDRLPAEVRGVSISIYLFVSGLVGSIAPALLGSLDDGASWTGLRKYLFLFVGISYFGAGTVFLVMAFVMSRRS